MKKIFSISLMIAVLFLAACEGRGKMDRLEAEKDSIRNVNEQLNAFLAAVSESIDSILIQEGYIFSVYNGETSVKPSKQQIQDNLDAFEGLLERQRRRISELEDSLSKVDGTEVTKLKNIIRYLNIQMEEKDRMIAGLRSDLSKKNADIAQLRSHVSALSEDVSNLQQKSQEQEEALTVQSDMLNEGYVKAGTKKELQAAGLLSSSGLFGKKKLDVSNLNPEQFTKIDIREFQELKIAGKKPKILTQMPESSYRFDSHSDGTTTLVITDPLKFWGISNFLVIEYK